MRAELAFQALEMFPGAVLGVAVGPASSSEPEVGYSFCRAWEPGVKVDIRGNVFSLQFC